MSQSIERAIEVLGILAAAPQTPAEVSRRLDVHRSTALRIMALLTTQRLLRKLPDGRYGIGPGLVMLAHRALEQFDLVRTAHPHLVELSSAREQTVHFAELQGDAVVYVDKIDPVRSIRLTSRVGQAAHLHTASVAKAILAFQPEERLDALLREHTFERFTDTTITTVPDYLDALEQVRDRGWACDDGENENFIVAIGAPVRDASGTVVAAVSVIELKAVAPLQTLVETMLAPLRATADAISADLGWAPDVHDREGTRG